MKEIRIRWWARGFYKPTSKLHAFMMADDGFKKRNLRAQCGFKLARGISSFSPDVPSKNEKTTQCQHCLRLVLKLRLNPGVLR